MIEKLLEGSLTRAEQAAIDQLSKEDPSFREEVRLHRALGTTLKGEGIHDFRAALKEVDDQWEAPGKGKVRQLPIRRMLSLAATVLVLIAAGWWFSQRKGSASNEELFAARFEPYTMVLNQRSAVVEDPQEILLQQAITTYNQGQFAEAAVYFRELQTFDPDNQSYQFYTCISEMANGNPKAAIPVLEQLLDAPDHLLSEQSRWYLALAYLKVGQNEQSLKQLAEIQPGAYQYEESLELRKTVEALLMD